MFELLALGALLLGGLIVLGTIGLVLKVAFWIVLFPLRLLFKLIFLPFLLIGFVLKLALGVLLLPVLLVGGLIGGLVLLVGGFFAVLLPLLPVVLAGLLIYVVAKRLARPATAPPVPPA